MPSGEFSLVIDRELSLFERIPLKPYLKLRVEFQGLSEMPVSDVNHSQVL